MKKKICGAAFLAALCLSTACRVQAADGESPFQVSYAEGKLTGNYSTAEVENEVSGMQPGDTASFGVALYNGDNGETQWYMKNTILKSMEEESSAAGGAYSYRLTYLAPDGEGTLLFDSETLGGEGSQGLHEADGALEDHFYLGNLGKGEQGKIVLEIGLDGETQGNSYMTTFANMSMNFAVMPAPEAAAGGGSHHVVKRQVVNNEVVYVDENGDPVPLADLGESFGKTGLVKTGDERALEPYIVAACASGILLLLYGILGRRKREDRTEEAR